MNAGRRKETWSELTEDRQSVQEVGDGESVGLNQLDPFGEVANFPAGRQVRQLPEVWKYESQMH